VDTKKVAEVIVKEAKNNMQKSKIEWCDYSLNPVKGLCPMHCKDNFGKEYCYAARPNGLYKRFKWEEGLEYVPEVMMNLNRFNGYRNLLTQPSRFFVGSTMELFGDWIKPEWLADIFERIQYYPEHTFIFLTKQPQNLIKYSPFPSNCWIGVSVTDKLTYADALHYLGNVGATVHFLSFEPLLKWDDIFPKADGDRMLDHQIDWLILGQCTPTRQSTQPKIEWLKEIIEAADKSQIPIFLKNNLRDLLVPNALMDDIYWASDKAKLRQEFPNESR
jgi:protein gp37